MSGIFTKACRAVIDWFIAPAIDAETSCTNCPRRSVCEAKKSWVQIEADLEREYLISREAARKYVVGNTGMSFDIPPTARRGPDA